MLRFDFGLLDDNNNIVTSNDLIITESNSRLFVEGIDSYYPAGTNVVVVNVGPDTYKFDVIAGFVDLTAYAKTADQKTITDALSGRIQTIEDSYVTKVKTTHTSSTSTETDAHKNQLTVAPNVDTTGAVNITIDETNYHKPITSSIVVET